MKIMKVFAFAITVSMLGGGIASAHTVVAPQSAVSSQVNDSGTFAAKIPDMSHDSKTSVMFKAEPSAEPLAFANFGQSDESGTEN
ncbi:hypothetical protein [Acidisoma cladoniae]|jgi:hypothetical protein|uniref:hypothetical protein n=1 Tax=Acidisoma cladoniae TaxID=3040935 RepID=UPI00254CDF41|nr:hypothetical protein [Acidisoma sp. PAMC 29798]